MSPIDAQSPTAYTPLFTGATFTKTINQTLSVGTVGATADVSNGTASYNIPIVLPPGTNGVEPSVSVSYNSMGGNGLLGQGWSISGLSIITRATQNKYFDGEVQPILIASTDKYALDGQRLILDAGVYKTESENFSTITANGTTGGGPTWFKVEAKDGSVMEYGNTVDSRFMNEVGTTVLFWRLNKIIYKDGNYIEYKYTNADRDSRIDEILYTGNATSALLPYNKVKFNYSVRTDINTTYEAGQKVVSKYLLDNIVVTTESNVLVKSYEFKYGNNNISSYLKEVIEKGSDGSALNSTILKYGDEPTGTSAFSTSTTTVGQNLSLDYFSADLNGDGYSDFVALERTIIDNIVYHTGIKPYIKVPDHTSTAYSGGLTTYSLGSNYIAFQQSAGPNHSYTASDFNGDGLDDILLTKTEGNYPNRKCTELRIFEGTTSAGGLNGLPSIPPYTSDNINNNNIGYQGHYYQIGDFNGDGRSDIMTYLGGNVSGNVLNTYPAIRYGGSFTWVPITSTGIIPGSISWGIYEWHKCDKIIVLDFNGDGKGDLMQIKDGITNIISINELGNITVLYNAGFPTKWHHLYFGDFNGDRKSDILCRTDANINTNPWKLNISNGNGFVESNWAFSQTPNVNENYFNDQIIVNDFNGDGKSDVAHCRNTSTTSKIDMYYAKGVSGNNTSICGTANEGGTVTLTAPAGRTFIGAHFASYGNPTGTCGNYSKGSCHSFNSLNITNTAISSGLSTITIAATNATFGGDPCVGTSKKLTVEAIFDVNFYKVQHSFFKNISTDPKNVLIQDINGDGRTDLLNTTVNWDPKDLLFFRKEGQEHLLQKIKNGYDHNIEFQYKRLTQTTDFYTQGSITAHPVNTIQVPFYVVSRQNVENGIGGNTTIDFKYEEAKLHKEGKGFLGFKRVKSINQTSGFTNITETEINPTFYTLAAFIQSSWLNTGSPISSTLTVNEFVSLGNKRFWARVNSTAYYNNFEGRNSTSSVIYDTNGNVTQSISKIQIAPSADVEIKTIDYTLYESWGTPIPAKPRYKTEKRFRTGQADFITTTKFDYNSLGQLTGKTDFYGLTKNVITGYTYNSLGNQTGMTVNPANMTPRTTSSVYDTKGRYAESSTNELGQVSFATFDNKWGKPLTQTGITGLISTFTYDAFGRLKTIYDNQKLFTITETYAWDINSSEGTVHSHRTTHPGQPDVKVYFDIVDRERKREEETFGTVWTIQKTTYDSRGNKATATLPYKSGETILTTSNLYDFYNRLQTVGNTIGTTSINYTYSGGNLTTTTTSPSSQVSSKVTDPAGKLISAIDYGGTLTYTYYSHGGVREVKNGTLILTTSEYDEYGRQKKLIDINAGTTQYVTDAIGQLTSMTTATGQVNNYDYDIIGRKILHTRAEGNTSYEYWPSNSSGATNQIKKVTSYGGMLEEYTYDLYGRVITKKETVDALPHTTTFSYNLYDDVTSVLYPSGFKANYIYDANGFITHIKNTDNTVTLFTNTSMNGLGQYTGYSTGNGKTSSKSYYFGIPTNFTTAGVQNLTFNWNYQSGNLTSRVDAIKSKTESFTYDNLNRLLGSSGATLTSITNAYTANGNIDTKTDVGTYSYDPLIRINAVNNVTNGPNNISPNTQNIVFSSFYQPLSISENNYLLNYTYGADDQRIKSVMRQNLTVINTRYYFGDYEKDITGTTTRHLHYISNGSSLIAIVERQGTSQTDIYHYTYTDYLGSILATTNNLGVIDSEQNYDAWGRNRNTTSWLYTSITAPPIWLYRGYTGHEHIPLFGLINMNGRLYDPLLARMLSPDNNVQAPDFTQNYNRYSYALNNPLRYTDPDGEFIIVPILIGAAISVLVNGIENLGNNRNFFAGAGRAAIIGGISGAVSFGIGNIAAGAVASGQTTALGGKIFQALAHGISGEMMSVMNGGKLGAGFLSGAISSGASSALGGSIAKLNKLLRATATMALGGVTGGIGAKIAGGKFIDGFRQGLITSGLNHGVHAGYFGKGIGIASITGQTRHLFSPDAIAGEFEIGGAGGPAGVRGAKGGVYTLVGPDKGKFHTFTEIGIGGGWDATLGVSGTEFYYSGAASDFKPLDILAGVSHMYSGGGTLFGVDFGGGVGYANVAKNKMVYMFSVSVGFTGSPINIGESYFRNTTVFDGK